MRRPLRLGVAALAALAVLAVAVAGGGRGTSASAATKPVGTGSGGLRLNRIGTFAEPVDVLGAPGYPRLLFVVERAGVVRVLRRGKTLPRPFLDIRSLVGDSYIEQGLLSIAFPPDYRRSRRFYAYYTDTSGSIRVAEFLRSRTDPARALGSSRRDVIAIPHPGYANHDGGQLAFHGEDLLIGTGDGGSGGDPPNNAQNLDSLLGKLLRIDPRDPRGPATYSVPASNPFVGRPGRDEVFSYGLRNPFRFSIQSVAEGPDRVAIGDVGQNRYEEVDYETLPAARGANFGWDAFEGFEPYDCGNPDCPSDGTPDPGGTLAPIHAYSHSAGCSITGGLVVRDPYLAALYRRYVYADFCAGEVRSLVPALSGAGGDTASGLSVPHPSSFGETPDGRVFLCSLEGGVYRIAPS
ncbi:MAG: PQQ-dependent sugar dehydrogenase [Solirubrobacterales bacterium]